MKDAALIYNPIAGGNPVQRERHMRQAVEALHAAGIAAKLVTTSAPGAARDLAERAVAEGVKLILTCGGDGTINEAVNGMTPGDAMLGILPGGTANIFARELGMPLDPLQAARELIRWMPRRIALGRATWTNGPENSHAAESRYFLSLAGLGLDAYIIHKLSRSLASALGVAAYGWEALRQVLRYPFPTIACRVKDREIRATFALVQRTERYAGWLHLAPGANVFKDEFTFCAFKSTRRWRYLGYAAAIAARRHTRLSDVELVQTCCVECAADDTSARVFFELDGEWAGQLPATFEIVPDSLTVLVP